MSDKIFLSCRVSSKHNNAEMKGESNSVGNWEINQICINEQMRGVYLRTTIIINLNASYINLWQTILSLSCLAGTEVFKHYWSQEKKISAWQRWDSNPRPRRDWCLKPAP